MNKTFDSYLKEGAMKGKIVPIESKLAIDFLLPLHYAGRKPNVSLAFGWYDVEGDAPLLPENLKAVCTFGKPASNALCESLCGPEYSKSVYELNRLVRADDWDQQLSQLVSFCLRSLEEKNWIIVSYSDTGMGHHGYIYQACNFIYTGVTKERTDPVGEDNKHSRHIKPDQDAEFRKIRTAKHRYVYFCTKGKKPNRNEINEIRAKRPVGGFKPLMKEWLEHFNYDAEPYPKGDNENYVLGTVQKEKIVPA